MALDEADIRLLQIMKLIPESESSDMDSNKTEAPKRKIRSILKLRPIHGLGNIQRIMSNNDFCETFRMKRQTFACLADMIRKQMREKTSPSAISLEHRLLMTLR